jgi:hypothetical protein
MPLTVTLADMRAAVRERSDTVNSARITNTKLDRAINSSIRRLYAKIVPLAEDDFTDRTVLSTDDNGQYATLPSDFLVLRDIGWDDRATVDITILLTEDGDPLLAEDGEELWTEDSTGITSDEWAHIRPMVRFQLQERARFANLVGWHRGRSTIAYRLLGPSGIGSTPKRVEFLPPARARKAVVVWYVPSPPTLSAATDVFDGRSGLEEWVIWDASIQILIAEESDAGQATRERDYVYEHQVLPLLSARDQARPDRVIDTESEGYDIEEFGAPY